MEVLIVGSGGREDAIARCVAQSDRVKHVYVAPGNGGTHTIPKASTVPISATDISGLVNFADDKNIGLTIVGPEDPLARGIVDAFQAANLRILGPTAIAAQLESSKVFAKKFMDAHGVPTAAYEVFDDHNQAINYVQSVAGPCVVKADGLAAGKGVYVCRTTAAAEEAIAEIMVDGKYGNAGNQIIVEELLDGYELSVHVFCDGAYFIIMPPSQDYKRLQNGDRGPNTGGMGAICPVPCLTREEMYEIFSSIITRTIQGMAANERPFRGILYCGLMMTADGPKVLEYNVRFGDPEAQVVLPMLISDFTEIADACIDETLEQVSVHWNDKLHACCIVVASDGYPGSYETGKPITGLDEIPRNISDVIINHAGTAIKDGQLVTNGGRVLSVTGIDTDLGAAQLRARDAAQLVIFDGAFYRTDIGSNAG